MTNQLDLFPYSATKRPLTDKSILKSLDFAVSASQTNVNHWFSHFTYNHSEFVGICLRNTNRIHTVRGNEQNADFDDLTF